MSDESPIIVEVVDKVAPSIKANLREIGEMGEKAYLSIDKLKNALANVSKGNPVSELQAQLKKMESALALSITAQDKANLATLKAETVQQKLAIAQNNAAASAQKLAAEQARTAKALTDSQAASDRAAAAALRLQNAQDAAEKAALRLAKGNQASSNAMQANGISARDMTNRLRTIPMQMTDIIVSLQGGQAPLTVLLQQGGQLKDVFGGILPALKAVGGYLLTFVSPLTLIAAAVAGLAFAFNAGQTELLDFQNAATMTGNSIGLTNSQFSEMTNAISAIAGTKGKAADALTEIAKAGNLTGSEIQNIATTAVLMEKATGQALSKTVEQFSELAKEPVNASLKLNETYQYLTASTYEQIKALTEQGNKLAAAELAEKSYADAMTGRAKQVVENVGYMERAWRGLLGTVKGVWDYMKNIGRESSTGDKLASLQKQLADVEGATPKYGAKGDAAKENQAGKLKDQINLLQEQDRLLKKGNERQVEANETREKTLQAAVRVDAVLKQTETNKEKRDKLSMQTRKDMVLLGKSEVEIQKALSNIQDKYKDPKGPKAKSTTIFTENEQLIASIKRVSASIQEEYNQQDKLTKVEQFAAKTNADISSSKFKYSKETLALKDALLEEMKATEALNLQRVAGNKALEENVKNRQIDIDKTIKDIEQIEDQINKQIDHNNSILMTKEATAQLSAEREREGLIIQELAAIKKYDRDLDIESYDWTMKRIASLRQLADLKQRGGMLETAASEAKEAEKEWSKFNTSLYNGIVDNLERAFKKGSGFFNSLWQGIKDAFRGTVLKLLIQGSVTTAASAMGMSGLAQAGSAFTNGSNLISGIGNLFSGGGIGSSAAGMLGSGISSLFGATAGNAAIGGALGLGSGSATAAALAAAQAGGATLTAGATAMAGSMASLGSTLAAVAGPIGLAIVAGSLISGMMSKKDARFGGTYSMGANGEAAYRHGPVKGFGGDSGVAANITGAARGINALFKGMGSSLSLSGYQAGSETSNKGRGGVMAGGTLSNGMTFGESGQGSNYNGTYYERSSSQSPDAATAAANLATDLKQSVIQAMQAAAGSIPKLISDQVRGIDAESLSDDAASAIIANIEAQVKAVGEFREALKSLPFENLKSLSFDAAAGLIEASGGLQSLSNNLKSYYDNFYTEEEKIANTRKNISSQLQNAGLNVSTQDLSEMSRKDFRTMVEAQDVNTESGRKAFAALMSVNGAFAELTKEADGMSEAAKKLADIMDGLRERTMELRIQAERALGNGSRADSMQRAIDTKGYDAAALAIYDYNAALEKQIQVTATAKEALIQAYKTEVDSMQATVSKFTDFAKSLTQFREGLLIGDKSPLSPMQQYAQAQSNFADLSNKAKNGTPAEREDAMSKLQSAATTLLDMSAVINASGSGYTSDFATVQGALKDASISASATASVAQLQLDAAQRQVDLLTGINSAVVSVGAALNSYRDEMINLGRVNAAGANAEIVYAAELAARSANNGASGGGGQVMNNMEFTKAMQDLKNEMAMLRTQNESNTNSIVQGNYDANAQNANRVAEEQARQYWLTQKTKLN